MSLRRERRALARVAAVLGLAVFAAACASGGGANPQRPEPSRAETAAVYNLQLGVAYLQQGNLPLAKEKLERALQQNPRDATTHGAMALLNEKLGNVREADRYYRSALRLAPRNPDLTNNYAVFLCRSGNVDEALEKFREATRNALYRTPWRAHINAGVCLRGAKRYDDAAASFTQALRLRPGDAEAAFQFGELELERGRPAAARDIVDRYLAANNATPELLWVAARAARGLGDRLAEERLSRRLQRDFPDSPQARAAEAETRAPGSGGGSSSGNRGGAAP
jgi:type IV pilus assembly protein PilF